jgi:hypothetical protein
MGGIMEKDYAKMAEALKLARVFIESGSEVYVCYALHKVGRKHKELIPSINEVKRWINESLGSSSTVYSWCVRRGYIKRWPVGDIYPSDERLREYRLAWIDNMIQALKTE